MNLNNKKLKIVRKNLVTLLSIFEGKPNLFAQYLLDYDILSDDMKNMLLNNTELTLKSKELEGGNIEKPYFVDITDINNFYSKFFIIHKDVSIKMLAQNNNVESLIDELKIALSKEEYEKASKIRDYLIINGVDIKNLDI